jgi:sugar phosphate isomerase/epimerase
MNLNRREMLKLGAGSAAACAVGAFSAEAFAEPKKDKIPIGLQLYSVRRQCAEDLPAVLKAVSKMGYEGVEFAGYYDRTAKEMKKLLDDNGLKCCGTHLRAKIATAAQGKFDEFDAEVEYNQVLGNPYLIFPSMPENMRNSVEACKKTGAVLDTLVERAAKADGYVGYHAHGGDFHKVGDSTQWDLLFENSCDRVVMQMDVGNCIGGGGDPYATLKKFPGRSLTIHLKEHGGAATAAVGEGEVDWKQNFNICESVGGTKWYIVEHERGDDPLASVEACMKSLRKMGK